MKDERALLKAEANLRTESGGYLVGWVTLTTHNLLFETPHSAGSMVALGDVRCTGDAPDVRVTQYGLGSYVVETATYAGGSFAFYVLTRRKADKWATAIRDAVLTARAREHLGDGYVSQGTWDKLFAAAAQPKQQDPTPKPTVVQCTGCGAFVIATPDKVDTCEYCGKPYTV